MAKLVSQVYAEALFGLGVENGLLDTLLEELNGMCEILGKNPQFVTLLGHPELTDFVSLQIHYQVDAALIGGLKIQIGDRVVDSSIQNRLKRIKDSLMRVSLS